MGEALLFGEPADTLPPTMGAAPPSSAPVSLSEALATSAPEEQIVAKVEAIKIESPKIEPVKVEAEPVKIEVAKDEAPTIVEAAVEERAPQLITIAKGSELSKAVDEPTKDEPKEEIVSKEAPVAKEEPVLARADVTIPVPAPSSKSLSKKEKKKQKRDQQQQKAAESLAPRIVTASSALPATSTAPTVVTIDDAGDGIEDDPVSLQFFRSSDSVPPFVDAGEAAEEEEPRAKPPSPEQIAHRAKLRRVVMGVVAAASLVVVLGLGKSLVSAQTSASNPADAARTESAAPKIETAPTPAEQPKKAEEPKKVEAAAEAKPEEAKPAEDAKAAEEAKKAEEAKAEEEKKKADEAKAEEEKKKAEAPTGDVKELKKKATVAINRGDNKATVEAANAALAADPSDALMYLYLGTAYMNMGKAPDAREAFNECMRKATTGPKWECSAMGGRK